MKCKGFTLAEILITLVIIGIVAALTIPSLIQNTQNDAAIAGLRKVMSNFGQLYTSFNADDIRMETVWAGNNQGVNVMNQLATKLNVIKRCSVGVSGCFPDSYKYLSGNNAGAYVLGYEKAILADGSSIALADNNGACISDSTMDANPTVPIYYTCGVIFIDINGFKGPNQFGRDLFSFWATKTGIYPFGLFNDNYDIIPNECSTSNEGKSCAAKILKESAVNY